MNQELKINKKTLLKKMLENSDKYFNGNIKLNEKNMSNFISLFNNTICDILSSTKAPLTINIRGFLKFTKSWQKARYNTDPRNPTQKTLSKAKYIVRCKVGKTTKLSANK